MSMFSFLSSLPALLGILGFVIFLIVRQYGKSDAATLKIIEKLRVEAPEKLKEHTKLNSKHLFELLSKDNSLRKQVSNQDFSLLQQALRQQFIVSLFVYVICTLLFLAGITLFTYQINKPEPLSIENIKISSDIPLAKGLAVDLDPLIIQWISSGEESELQVFIENLDTKRRSKEFLTNSSSGSLEILSDDYIAVLEKRIFKQWNRIRVVIQSKNNSFVSKEFNGIILRLYWFSGKRKVLRLYQ